MSYLFRASTILKHKNLRLFKKVKEYLKEQYERDAMRQAVSGNYLQENERFQFPTKLEKEENRVPQTPEEEQALIQEMEAEASNLEKIRMQELDKIYGTNTYFHPINEAFEERLDSEFVMERKRSKRRMLKELGPDRFFEFDPQEKIEGPKVRNWQEYYKNLNQISKLY